MSTSQEFRRRYAWVHRRLQLEFGAEAVRDMALDYDTTYVVGVELTLLDGERFRYALQCEGFIHRHPGRCQRRWVADDTGHRRLTCVLPRARVILNRSRNRRGVVEGFVRQIRHLVDMDRVGRFPLTS